MAAFDPSAYKAECESKMTYTKIMDEKIKAMLQEAAILCDHKDPDRAVRKLTRAIALQPRNAELFKQRAEAYILLRDYHSAILNFHKVLSLSPSEQDVIHERLADVNFSFGEVLYEQGKYSQAIQSFENVCKYRQEDRDTVMKRIACLLSLKRYGECLEMIKEQLEVDNTNPDLYVFKAQLNILFGNTTEGYYNVCSALELNPAHEEALRMKAELEEKAHTCKNQAIHHSLLGKKMDALKKITTAIESDPAVAEYHILRGALYRRMRDFNAAVDDYLTAMDKCSHRQDSSVYKNACRQLVLTYNDFAMECFRRRYFNEAVVLLNKAIKEEKNETGLYLNRGDCFYRLNNLPFSLADYQQALELDPANWGIYCRVAVVCCEMGVDSFSADNYNKAEKHFTTAIHHNSRVSRFYLCRARARNQLKDKVGTEEDIIAALILNPDCQESFSLIARVFPGKTKDDLIQGVKADSVRSNLESEMIRISSLCSQTHEMVSEDTISPQASKHLANIGLKFSEAGGGACASHTSPRDCSSGENGLEDERPCLQILSPEGTAQIDTQDKEVSELSPRAWSILYHPLPELSANPHGVVPELKSCLQEDDFHRNIYYTKKSCTEEVEHLLKTPAEDYGIADRPPRIQIAHDVVFGNRTIATASSLLRTVNDSSK